MEIKNRYKLYKGYYNNIINYYLIIYLIYLNFI